jgi:hypothetical protein
LANSVLREIDKAECATAKGRRLHLRVAIDYSSRDAITRAVADATATLSNQRSASPDSLGPLLVHALNAQGRDVDLLIRTGGEQRLSDFLLWESAYAELVFTDRMWPDFDEADLEAALEEFNRRERRFGGVPESLCSGKIRGPHGSEVDGARPASQPRCAESGNQPTQPKSGGISAEVWSHSWSHWPNRLGRQVSRKPQLIE